MLFPIFPTELSVFEIFPQSDVVVSILLHSDEHILMRKDHFTETDIAFLKDGFESSKIKLSSSLSLKLPSAGRNIKSFLYVHLFTFSASSHCIPL